MPNPFTTKVTEVHGGGPARWLSLIFSRTLPFAISLLLCDEEQTTDRKGREEDQACLQPIPLQTRCAVARPVSGPTLGNWSVTPFGVRFGLLKSQTVVIQITQRCAGNNPRKHGWLYSTFLPDSGSRL